MLIEYFKKYYSSDSRTGAYQIEISLDKYTDVFNEWDPAPFKKRDIDPAFEDYLKGCSSDIPLKYKIELFLCLPEDQYDIQKEGIIKEGIKTYFQSKTEIIKKTIRFMNKNTGIYALVSVVFLILALSLETSSTSNVFINLLLQGLFIGGWVFLWEALNIFVFHKSKIKYQYRVYERLLRSDIEFKYISLTCPRPLANTPDLL